MDNGHNFISAICYEILFSDFIRDYLNAQTKPVHFLINLTNDSWYGKTSEPWQHLFLARWRALEFNIPIIRSTNTGITTVITPNGHFNKYLGVNEQTVLDVDVPLFNRTPTFYEKYGRLPFVALILGTLIIHFILNKIQALLFKIVPKEKTRGQYYTEEAKLRED